MANERELLISIDWDLSEQPIMRADEATDSFLGSIRDVEREFSRLENDGTGAFRDVERASERAADGVDRVGREGRNASNSIENSFKGMGQKIIAALGLAYVADQIKEFGKDATKDFVEFDKGMNEIFTLLPDISKQGMDKMEQQVTDFSNKMGVLPEKAIPAIYEAISSGVPKDNVFDFIAVAEKAAVGGVTELATTVDGLTSVINAYGKESMSAEKASDLMFQAVKFGKTTFGELADSLFNVNPVAAGLGIKFEDVTASLAALTNQGVPTRVATTQIRTMMAELGKEGQQASDIFKELAGKSFNDFIKGGGDLQGALKIMEQGAKDTNLNIMDMFGSIEGGQAALALTGKNTQGFTDALKTMDEASGSTQGAFDQMEKSTSRGIDKLTAKWATMKVKIGDGIATALVGAMPQIEEKLPQIESLMTGMFNSIANIITTIVLPAMSGLLTGISFMKDNWDWMGPIILGVVGGLVAYSATVKIVTAVTTAWNAIQMLLNGTMMLNPIGLVVAGIVALIAIGILLYKNWDTIVAFLGAAWDWIKNTAVLVWDGIANFFIGVWEWIKGIFQQALDFVLFLFFNFTPLGILISHFDEILAFLGAIWETIKNIFSGALQGILDFFFNWTPLGIFISHFDEIIAFLTNLPSKFLELGGNIIQGIIDGLLGGLGKVKDFVGNLGDTIMGGIKGFFGIASPSKLMMEMGGFIGDGLDLGMTGTIPDLQKTSDEVSKAALPVTSPESSVEAPAQAAQASVPAGVNVNNTIEVNYSGADGEGDSQELAEFIDSRLKALVPSLVEEFFRQKRAVRPAVLER